MKITFILTILLLVSCAKKRPDYIKPGQTLISSVIEKEGPPLKVKDSSFDKSREIYQFNDFNIQTNNKKVEAVFRKPELHEKSLQYWRQLYKNESTTYEKIDSDGHEEIWQFQIKSKGISVTYNKSMNQVTRITNHE